MYEDITVKVEELKGEVGNVKYHNEDSLYTVFNLKASGMLVPCVGKAPKLNEGELVTVRGMWGAHKLYGKQFNASIIIPEPPINKTGIIKYLVSSTKGISSHYAKKIVNIFGEGTFDIIEKTPDRLMEVEGIGKKRMQLIAESFNENRAIRDVMTFLHGLNVSPSKAVRIYKAYGDESVSKIKANPYELSYMVWGISFKTADAIAESVGIEKESIFRIMAGVNHILEESTSNGNCGCEYNSLIDDSKELLDVSLDMVSKGIDRCLSEKRFYDVSVDGQRIIIPSFLYYVEKNISKIIKECVSDATHLNFDNVKDFAENKLNIKLSPTQGDALESVLENKVSVITGGAGVGKTTLIRSLIENYKRASLDIVLSAPTGRAAQRMSEVTGHNAQTIHRLLGYSNGKFNDSISGDVFIIDEASMIDVTLAYYLLKAIPQGKIIIFVGDENQLPSVGAGRFFADLTNSNVVNVCRLTEVFRQAKDSNILINAHRINKGELPIFNSDMLDCRFKYEEDPYTISQLVVSETKKYVKEYGLNNVQVLTPMKVGGIGAGNLNDTLQKSLNFSKLYVEKFGVKYKVGDKVMQIRNNYEKNIFNGDVGYITGIDFENKVLKIKFYGSFVDYDFNEIDELVLAYACTIHKSQGSEYKIVIIPIHTSHCIMLKRNLLYTAITRAKEKVIFVGTTKAMSIAVATLDTAKRITMLNHYLCNHL
jgi:exodeoxyribonuclease V alpha subunit